MLRTPGTNSYKQVLVTNLEYLLHANMHQDAPVKWRKATLDSILSQCMSHLGLNLNFKIWTICTLGNQYALVSCGEFTQCKKTTIHQLTTMLSTFENNLIPGHNHLLTTSADDPTLWLSPERQHQRWLALPLENTWERNRPPHHAHETVGKCLPPPPTPTHVLKTCHYATVVLPQQ